MKHLKTTKLFLKNVIYYKDLLCLSSEQMDVLLKQKEGYFDRLKNGYCLIDLEVIDKISKIFCIDPYQLLQPKRPLSTGEFIRLHRKFNKMTCEKLAELIKVSRVSVHKWESDRVYPEKEHIQKLAKVFKIDYHLF